MKRSFFLLFLFLFLFSGCSLLEPKEVPLSDDSAIEETEGSSQEQDEESIDDGSSQEEYFDDEEGEEEDAELETSGEEELLENDDESSGGITGFFKNLFGGSSSSDSLDEVIPDEEGYEVEEDEVSIESEIIEDDDDEDDEESIDEEDGDGSIEDDDEEEDAESSGGITGFFKNLFSSNEQEEEFIDGEQDEFVDDEQGEFVDDQGELVDDREVEFVDDEQDGEFVDDEQDGEFVDDKQVEEAATEDSSIVNSFNTQQSGTQISLRKILRQSYFKNSHLINAVYIARPNESFTDISRKIYGNNQTQKLQDINPHLQNRNVVVGDKIYYSSPNRTANDGKILFYYKDIGAQASNYQISAGQNIRQVSKQLLGHNKSWKEIWATNPQIQSKGVLEKDIFISYFPIGVKTQTQRPRVKPPVFQEDASAPQEKMNMPEESMPTSEADSPFADSSDKSFEDNNEPEEFSEPENQQEDSEGLEFDQQQTEDGFLDQKTSGILALVNFAIKDKRLLGISLAGLIILIFLIRLLIKRARKPKDFDYTAF